jgi:SAM-dependent methyltransferase
MEAKTDQLAPSLRMENRMYQEFPAGFYSRQDCTVAFFTRVHSLLDENTVLLNLGAGRGRAAMLEPSPFRRKLQLMRGRVKRVIGIDVDEAVKTNPDVDEAHVIDPFGAWPIEAESIDVILCDHVLEHVEDPDPFIREIHRVLKPGGWLCARTPAKWGYIGLGARLIPNSLHVNVLKRLQPNRKAEDVFPVVYRLNSFTALNRFFSSARWRNCTYGYNGVPSYHGNNAVLFRLIQIWCWLMPERMSAKYHIFIHKKG